MWPSGNKHMTDPPGFKCRYLTQRVGPTQCSR
jgi:hypothetical protein